MRQSFSCRTDGPGLSQSDPFRSRSGTLLNPLSGGYGSRPRPKTGPPRGSFSPSSGQQFSQISAKIIFLKNKWTRVEPKCSFSVAFGYPFEPAVWGLRLQNPSQNWTAGIFSSDEFFQMFPSKVVAFWLTPGTCAFCLIFIELHVSVALTKKR